MKMMKRICCILLLAVMMFNLPVNTYAAGNVSMKKTKVKWDLKPKKKYRVKSIYLGIGKRDIEVKITNFKKRKKNGKVTVTFTVTQDLTVFKPTKDEVHKMIAAMNREEADDVGGYTWSCVVVDYSTGKNLDYQDHEYDMSWDPEYDIAYDEDKYEDVDEYIKKLRGKDTGVRVSVKDLKPFGKVTTYDDDGCSVWLEKYSSKYKITYPASYKNLCIGIGGCSYYGVNEAEEKFLCGVTAFKNLKDYKMKPSNWHFMRVK